MRRRTFLRLSAGAITASTVGAGHEALAAGAAQERLVVAADGSGDFTGIQAAVDAAPNGNVLIAVRPGTYRGQVVIPAAKPLIRMHGLGRRPQDVVIADDRANGTLKPD